MRACVRACACVCMGVRGCGCLGVCVCARVCVCVDVRAWVCIGVRGCGCGGTACVRARVCVSYLHSLLTPIKKPTQHRSSGSVLHFTPIVNTNIGSRFFSVAVLHFGIKVYASFDLVRSDEG